MDVCALECESSRCTRKLDNCYVEICQKKVKAHICKKHFEGSKPALNQRGGQWRKPSLKETNAPMRRLRVHKLLESLENDT